MFSYPSMPCMPQMPFAPFPFAGYPVGGGTPSDQAAPADEDGAPTEQAEAPTTQTGLPGMQGVQFTPFPVIGLAQMQLSMQMQMISYMQQVLSQIQQQGAVAPSQDGMQLPFNMSIADLQKLLQLDASPKALAMLQQVLDVVFDAYTKQQ